MAKPATTSQLRADIDRGRTGSKVNAIDPAAAPLGTDEEAAGTPLSAAVVQQALDYERAIGIIVGAAPGGSDDSPSAIGIYLVIVLAVVALVATVVWLTHVL